MVPLVDQQGPLNSRSINETDRYKQVHTNPFFEQEFSKIELLSKKVKKKNKPAPSLKAELLSERDSGSLPSQPPKAKKYDAISRIKSIMKGYSPL